MFTNRSLLLGITAAGIVIAHGTNAGATDSQARRAAAERSLGHGFPEPVMAVLERTPGLDSTTITSRLGQTFCEPGCRPDASGSPAGGTRVRMSQWTFDISRDGNGVSSESAGQEESGRSIAGRQPTPPTERELEKIGRAFVAQRLVGLLTVERAEDLVPVSFARKSEGGTDGRREASSRVVASRVVFARRIQGVPVVGGGGTFTLTVANDGAPLSFAYDWPRYVARTSTQTVLPAGDLLARVQRVVAIRTSGSPADLPPLVSPDAASFPYEVASDTFLESFECGYVDSGDPARASGAPIQPGCSYRAIRVLRVPSGGNARSAFAGAVPGGETFERDERWAEAVVLSGGVLPRRPEGATAGAR